MFSRLWSFSSLKPTWTIIFRPLTSTAFSMNLSNSIKMYSKEFLSPRTEEKTRNLNLILKHSRNYIIRIPTSYTLVKTLSTVEVGEAVNMTWLYHPTQLHKFCFSSSTDWRRKEKKVLTYHKYRFFIRINSWIDRKSWSTTSGKPIIQKKLCFRNPFRQNENLIFFNCS